MLFGAGYFEFIYTVYELKSLYLFSKWDTASLFIMSKIVMIKILTNASQKQIINFQSFDGQLYCYSLKIDCYLILPCKPKFIHAEFYTRSPHKIRIAHINIKYFTYILFSFDLL